MELNKQLDMSLLKPIMTHFAGTNINPISFKSIHFSPFEYRGTLEFIDGYLAPVPLSIFRSNSKFDENSERSNFECTRPMTKIFCTRHDSDTVVTCAKYRCHRPRIFYTRVF